MPWNRPRWRTESNHAHAPAHIAAARMQDAGRVDRPSQHIPVNNAVDAIRVRPYVWNMPGRRHRNQHETLAALRNTDPKGQLHRAWQLRELLRTLLRHPLEQARGELKHWVFWRPTAASPRSRNSPGRFAGAGPTSSGPSSWATPTPGSRRPTTGSKSPSAWPTASTTSTTSPP